MVTVKVKEIINWVYSNFEDEVVKVHVIEAESYDGAFRQKYSMDRSARYDSARRYEFDDPSMEPQYRKWVKENETVELYYGGGTVD